MARARYKVGNRYFRHRRDAVEFSTSGTKEHVRSYWSPAARTIVYAGGQERFKGPQGPIEVKRVKREVMLDGTILRGTNGGRYRKGWVNPTGGR